MQTLTEVENSFQLVSDWIKAVRKNENKWKAVTLLVSLLSVIALRLLNELKQRECWRADVKNTKRYGW